MRVAGARAAVVVLGAVAAAALGGCGAQGAQGRGAATATAGGATPATSMAPETIASGDVDYPAARPAPPVDGFRADGVRRPEVRRVSFDVDGLPTATWRDPPANRGFSVSSVPSGMRIWMRSHIFAEAVVFGSPWVDGQAPVLFTAFTGAPFWTGGLPGCGGHGAVPARWAGFAPEGWTDDGIDVEIGEGSLDLKTCSASAHQFASGRASAIVRGFVYGLRVGRGADGDSDPDEPSDVLYVFLPRAAQLAASGDPEASLETADSGSFTRLTFPLTRGSARSASMRLSPASLRLWSAMRATRGPVQAFGDESQVAPDVNALLDVDVSVVDGAGPSRPHALASLSLALPPGVEARSYSKMADAVGKTEPAQ